MMSVKTKLTHLREVAAGLAIAALQGFYTCSNRFMSSEISGATKASDISWAVMLSLPLA